MNPVMHADDVAKDFQSLVSERILPIEIVSKVVVLSQGVLWKHRMIRDTSPPSNRRSSGLPDSSVIESQILTHVIAIHRVLLEIGAAELAVPPEDTAENDLAQRITAPFRRTLPALRIANKWLVANIKYVLHAVQSPVGEQISPTGKGTRGVLIEGLPLFWAKFAQFYSALSSIFPSARLPPLMTPLDEDIDLKGFLPLRDFLVGGGTLTDAVPGEGQQNGTPPHGREKVHPNEEQLMRIWDLLKDAKSLAELEVSSINVGDRYPNLRHHLINSLAPSI
jgi:protein SMG7